MSQYMIGKSVPQRLRLQGRHFPDSMAFAINGTSSDKLISSSMSYVAPSSATSSIQSLSVLVLLKIV